MQKKHYVVEMPTWVLYKGMLMFTSWYVIDSYT